MRQSLLLILGLERLKSRCANFGCRACWALLSRLEKAVERKKEFAQWTIEPRPSDMELWKNRIPFKGSSAWCALGSG